MTHELAGELARRRFRTGSAFELVLVDRLPIEEQAALSELRNDPEFYGVLRPRGDGGRTVKVVDRDTALLWFTQMSPGVMPGFVWREDPVEAVRGVTQLVLDGVFEMECDGAFVSGPDAVRHFAGARRQGRVGRLQRIALDALAYAETLPAEDGPSLANRLYEYGRVPISPEWARRLPNADAVLAYVGAAPGTDVRGRLETTWEAPKERTQTSWLMWSCRRRSDLGARSATFKLYVSPSVEDLPRAFAAVLALQANRPMHWKIGSDAAGLLRPDKMVLYFADQERMLATAGELQAALRGATPHGVPFTAEIADDGLLSWGMDPPIAERVLAWQEPESWRLWVVRRLAAALCSARGANASTLRPAEFALERLRHEGVDVDAWTPSVSIWRAA